MDKYLTKQQLQVIKEQAPKGADGGKIIQGLVARGYILEGFNDEPEAAPADQKGIIENAKDFSTGFSKGILDSSIQTARLAQTAGQGIIAAVDPNRNFEEVRADTGFKSLGGEDAQKIDEILKSENTAETVGKVAAFGAELLTPTGSRKVLQKGIEKGIGLVEDVATKGGEIIGKAGEAIAPAIQTTKNLATGLKDIVEITAEGAGRIPGRIATNVAEKKATRAIIDELPTQVAKRAVQDGVDLADIQYIYKIPKEQKAPFKTLLKATQDFEKGISKTNPIEVVGKPIVERIKQLETARGTIGQKLGAVANDLGNVSSKEVLPEVFSSLKGVPGLSGLKISRKGILDFTDTVLTTAETKADRKAIQSIFSDAIKSGTGKQKHLLRQELFESLGGKKKSLTNLTVTQERAYEAIRKALSNVLDTKNPTYKALNQEFAKVAQPLQDIRKLMKTATGAEEDILNMDAGLLARRLTGFSKSNPQIRNILRAMDDATKAEGKSQVSVESLQDFYNVLDKYYDIAGKTGFQGQVTSGVEKASSVKGFAVEALRKMGGQTDAVKRKAIEDALNEALK